MRPADTPMLLHWSGVLLLLLSIEFKKQNFPINLGRQKFWAALSINPDCFFVILGLKSNCEPLLSLLILFVGNLFGTPCVLHQSHGTCGMGYIVDVMSCCPPGFRCCDHWCDNPKVQPSHISQLHALVHQAGGLVQVEPCWFWSPGALVLCMIASADWSLVSFCDFGALPKGFLLMSMLLLADLKDSSMWPRR